MNIRKRLARWLFPSIFEYHQAVRDRFDILWTDHLRRCNCHDSWDQCPCTSQGHQSREARLMCPNKCCPWCSIELKREIDLLALERQFHT